MAYLFIVYLERKMSGETFYEKLSRDIEYFVRGRHCEKKNIKRVNENNNLKQMPNFYALIFNTKAENVFL